MQDPERYGVATFDKHGRVIDIAEKPENPQSNFAITGLYFFDGKAPSFASAIKPSTRGELEITDVNLSYMRQGLLSVQKIGRGNAWLDTGTHESLLQAHQFVQTIEQRQGIKIACPEEIALVNEWIDESTLKKSIELQNKNSYGVYLENLLSD